MKQIKGIPWSRSYQTGGKLGTSSWKPRMGSWLAVLTKGRAKLIVQKGSDGGWFYR